MTKKENEKEKGTTNIAAGATQTLMRIEFVLSSMTFPPCVCLSLCLPFYLPFRYYARKVLHLTK